MNVHITWLFLFKNKQITKNIWTNYGYPRLYGNEDPDLITKFIQCLFSKI